MTASLIRRANANGGVVGFADLAEVGLSRQAIRRRVTAGSLTDLGGGVFVVGHRVLSERGWRRAALIAAGRRSALSHWTAALLWLLTDRTTHRVHVSQAGRSPRGRCQSVDVHRPRHLDESDVTTIDGLRVTSLFRTLLDLAPLVADTELRRMVEQAFTRYDISPIALAADARGKGRRPGAARLAVAALDVAGPVELRSNLERAFRTFCEERGLPRYEANVPFEGWIIDGLWVEDDVAVELDFYTYHGARTAYRTDRRKGLALERAGIHLVRVAGEDLEAEPDEVEAAVLRALNDRRRLRGLAALAHVPTRDATASKNARSTTHIDASPETPTDGSSSSEH